MNQQIWSLSISRRDLLRSAAAAAAVGAGLPTAARAVPTRALGHIANVRVSDDRFGVHIEPSVAVNPRDPHQVLVACQASPTPNPEFLATYLSTDGGATWETGGVPSLPTGSNGDDVTVGFDQDGRGYVCATSYAGGRAVYMWRTDDGGHSYSPPVTLVAGTFCDHPWLAVGTGVTAPERSVYAVWGGSADGTALEFTRSTDRGVSFETPRPILGPENSTLTAGPEMAAGAHGLICVVCNRAMHFAPTHGSAKPSGDLVGDVVAVCSTNSGESFGTPRRLGSETAVISLPGGAIPNSGATVAVSPNSDAVYVAWTTHRPGATHQDIVVAESHDRGHSWSKPVIATPHDNVTYFQPNIAVDTAGRVGISAFALAHGRVNEVLLISRRRKLRFKPPIQVTSSSFNPHSATAAGRKHGAWWIGDYQGITTSGETFKLVWNDTRTGKLDLFAATVSP